MLLSCGYGCPGACVIVETSLSAPQWEEIAVMVILEKIPVERNGMMSACDVCMSHATLGAACSQNMHGTLMKGAATTQTTAACASSASSRPKMLFNYESIIMILYWRFIIVDSTINHTNIWTFRSAAKFGLKMAHRPFWTNRGIPPSYFRQ